MAQDDERAIIGQAAAGADDAFKHLYEKYYPPVYRFVLRQVPDEGRAHDITQEAFVRAWRNIRSFRGDSLFLTWLCKIAQNLIRDHYGRLRVTTTTYDDAIDCKASADDVDKLVFDKLCAQCIRDAIAGLPDKFRDVAQMAFIEELTETDIASHLTLSIGTVRSRRHEARTRIKDACRDCVERT